ncbi:MAG: hypothetical protein ABSB41_02345 [Anaerolineales bacterium]|jgi:hypothetical protein
MPTNHQRQSPVDPSVAEILDDMEHKRRLSALPKVKRDKARKDAARHKVGLDLPPALHESLREIADHEHISISSLAAFFALRGIDEYQAGKVDLSPFKRLSRSARFDYVLDIAAMLE